MNKKNQNQYNYESKRYLEKLNHKNFLWYEDVLKEVLTYQPQRVLELGCGNGDFSLLCSENNIKEITAVDNSNRFLKVAKNKSKNITFKKINLEKFQDQKSVFQKKLEVIVAIDVLEHLVNKNSLLQEMIQLKNIKFILQCPNLYCNFIGTNYEFKIIYMLIKLLRAIKGYCQYLLYYFLFIFFKVKINLKEVTTIKKGLDWKNHDDDAVVLTSSFWFLLFFKQNNFKLKKFTTFSFPTHKKWLKTILNIIGKLPFIAHLGGKMIFVVEKR